MPWLSIGPSIVAQRPLGELRGAFRRTDIIALDLDQCIFPGYSQTELGARVAWRVLRRPATGRDRRFLPQLGLGSALFAWKETKLFFGAGTPMRRLVSWYERVMGGVPEHYLLSAAKEIPPASYAFAAETVAELAAQAPTGLVTLGLDVVARAYLEQFHGPSGASLSFFDANVITFRQAGDHRVFDRYDPDAFLEDGADKRRALERRMASLGARVPSTVGHSDDDVPLARLSRERGGLAIGFNPSPRLMDAFDVVVRGRDWEPMYALVAILWGPPKASECSGEEGGGRGSAPPDA